MNRKSIVILVAGAMAMLSGCLMFYTGSEEGPFGVVAERDEPGRQKEVILSPPFHIRALFQLFSCG